MNVHYLHVDTSVLTLLVVLCAPVMKDIYWVVMEVFALVCMLDVNVKAQLTKCSGPEQKYMKITQLTN